VSELLGLVGTLIMFAGFHLLWQARHEIFFWLETYFRIFRASLRQPGQRVPSPARAAAPSGHHTLRLLLGFGLVFFLGPALIVLGLTL